MKQNQTLADLALAIGIKEIGVHESGGPNRGPRVSVYQDYIDGPNSNWMHGQPWCAAFKFWCVHQAAVKLGITPILKKTASSTDVYAQAKKHGLVLAKPIPGCIGLIRGSGGSPGKTHHHTFTVMSVEGGVVKTLDGNWGDKVCKTTHKIADCDFVALA